MIIRKFAFICIIFTLLLLIEVDVVEEVDVTVDLDVAEVVDFAVEVVWVDPEWRDLNWGYKREMLEL